MAYRTSSPGKKIPLLSVLAEGIHSRVLALITSVTFCCNHQETSWAMLHRAYAQGICHPNHARLLPTIEAHLISAPVESLWLPPPHRRSRPGWVLPRVVLEAQVVPRSKYGKVNTSPPCNFIPLILPCLHLFSFSYHHNRRAFVSRVLVSREKQVLRPNLTSTACPRWCPKMYLLI